MKKSALTLFCVCLGLSLAAAQRPDGTTPPPAERVTFNADRVAYDNRTKAAVALGNVHAVSGPLTLRGEKLVRDDEGGIRFSNPTCVTTCTNAVGHTHWNVTGEVAYTPHDSVVVRDAWLRFYEIPVFYLPYLWYPLDTSCGFAWMPGYTGRWGAFLLTRTRYHLVGDEQHRDNTWWLTGETDADVRYRRGFALGERLKWNLGNFGSGDFRVYYAWDRSVTQDDERGTTHDANWGSTVPSERYGFSVAHDWDITERDRLFLRGTRYSDSHFRSDFMRKTFLEIRNQWVGYENSVVAWEHLEGPWSIGAEVSGRLNDFQEATERLPEVYLDVNPVRVFSLPLVYESENRLGYLQRHYAEYARGTASIFGTRPGLWCDYDAFRLDTYHRVSLPMRFFDDVLSVVPRVGYRGTFWSESGLSDYTGRNRAVECGELYRSIVEGGVTFAARGSAWISDTWLHTIEPYADVLAQEASFSGRRGDSRPFVFDALDASLSWEDQLLGRGRNLPYSYYGVTPGFRQTWSELDEKGRVVPVADLDAYAAFSFGKTSFDGDLSAGEWDAHKLAELGKKNYGKKSVYVSPGVRTRWRIDESATLNARVEYDADANAISFGDVAFSQTLSPTFQYSISYALRDARVWDFASSPEAASWGEDFFNEIFIHTIRAGFTCSPVEWFAFSPYVRWDLDENELDSAGAWFDYLTDCLGFRLLVEYENGMTRIDGYDYDEDWNIGFYIYLRAFGADSGGLFSAQ